MNWISVEDKIPDYGEYALVIIDKLDPPIFFFLMEWRDNWICLADDKNLDEKLKVLFWMGIEMPPKY